MRVLAFPGRRPTAAPAYSIHDRYILKGKATGAFLRPHRANCGALVVFSQVVESRKKFGSSAET